MCKREREKWAKLAEECVENRCKVRISDKQLEDEIYKILCPEGVGNWAYATSRKRIEELIELFKRWR